MVRHIVCWSFKEEVPESEKKEILLKIKNDLESLSEKIEGIIEIKVYIDLLPSSDRDAILNSLFESEEALASYQINPEHKKVSAYVRSVMHNRVCIDYKE